MQRARDEGDGGREGDDALLRRLAEGDESALQELLAVHGARVLDMLSREFGRLLDYHERWGVMICALDHVWMRRTRPPTRNKDSGAWFVGIARNCGRNLVRKKRGQRRQREKVWDPADLDRRAAPGQDGVPQGSGTAPDDRRSASLRRVILKVCQKLPEIQRRIIIQMLDLRDWKESLEELAKELHLSVGTLRKYRQRAYMALRPRLGRYDPERKGPRKRRRRGKS